MKGYDFYGYYAENNGDGSSSASYEQVSGTYNPFYLEIPLLFALKYRVGNDMNLVFQFLGATLIWDLVEMKRENISSIITIRWRAIKPSLLPIAGRCSVNGLQEDSSMESE